MASHHAISPARPAVHWSGGGRAVLCWSAGVLISSYQADDDWAAVELFFTSQLSLELLLAVTPL